MAYDTNQFTFTFNKVFVSLIFEKSAFITNFPILRSYFLVKLNYNCTITDKHGASDLPLCSLHMTNSNTE